MSRSTLDEIEFHRAQLRNLISKSEVMRREACAHAPEFERLVALGGVMHSFYVGLESIFLRIAAALDVDAALARFAAEIADSKNDH